MRKCLDGRTKTVPSLVQSGPVLRLSFMSRRFVSVALATPGLSIAAAAHPSAATSARPAATVKLGRHIQFGRVSTRKFPRFWRTRSGRTDNSSFSGWATKRTTDCSPANQALHQTLTAKGIKHPWTVTPGYAHWWTLWRALKRHSKRFLLTMNVMGPTISCMRLHAAVTNASRVSAFRYLLQETSR